MLTPLRAVLRCAGCAVACAIVLGNAAAQTGHAPVVVHLMSQYDYPPFQTGPQEGLTFQLANYLTQQSKGAFAFQAEVLPRKRLDIYMNDAAILWVIPWAVPRFFGPDARAKFAWTKPVMQDGNHLLTQRGSPIQYHGPDSLAGLHLGGTAGHRYALLDPLLNDGRMTREDCSNLVCNVEKLKRKRVDVVWMPSAALAYFRQVIPDFDETIQVSPHAVETFERSFMLPKGQAALLRYMDTIAKKLPDDPAWTQVLSPAAPPTR